MRDLDTMQWCGVDPKHRGPGHRANALYAVWHRSPESTGMWRVSGDWKTSALSSKDVPMVLGHGILIAKVAIYPTTVRSCWPVGKCV